MLFQYGNLGRVLRACTTICCMLWLSAPCNAQIMIWKPNQTEFPAPAPAAAAEPHLLTISATAEPQPSLKYRFRESAVLRQPGSAGEILSRARYASLQIPDAADLQQQYTANSAQWHEAPLAELLDSDLSDYLAANAQVIKLVRAATRRARIELRQDVELDAEVGEAIDLSLVQDYRHFARLLFLQARWELANDRFDEAIECVGTGFRLAEILEFQKPSVISKLVEIAIRGLMLSAVEELVQQPACPNLYWALASVPDSYWNPADSLDGELVYQNEQLGPLMEPLDSDVGREDVNERLIQAVSIVPEVLMDESQLERPQAELMAGATVLLFTDKGREELIDHGIDPRQVGEMLPAAVVLESTRIGFAESRDAVFKWALLPNAEEEMMESFPQFSNPRAFLSPGKVLLGGLLPSIQAVQNASRRGFTIHRRAMLIEALRAYAAQARELPVSLENLEPLPAPINPQTGQLFEYNRSSTHEATIRNLPLYPGDQQTETVVSLRRE
ncbi:hypothetical protein [Aureliella helgolandensis]|uniref:Uncharacterized protein n=1 Tax=Aureliella helgolandensis TaxID=2527968 RepID=A0A518G5C9_9BACT|nr:hypothetical protein [Aureliella helgolandensis]QDV23780.1 hypothetical protein Q31a_20850 [Aureliella helgolandensis]